MSRAGELVHFLFAQLDLRGDLLELLGDLAAREDLKLLIAAARMAHMAYAVIATTDSKAAGARK